MIHKHDCPGCGIVWNCDLGRCMKSGAGYCDICWIVQERKLQASIREDVRQILAAVEVKNVSGMSS